MTNLEAFTSAVLAKLSTVDAKYRFGREKIFIAALEPNRVTRSMLIDAHRAGLLRLSRADLIPGMSQDMVAASQTDYIVNGMRLAEFHFISAI